MNHIADGIMEKDIKSTKLTDYEKERNKQISKKRYIVEQYFGLSHLYNNAFRARFTRIAKNAIDVFFRQMATMTRPVQRGENPRDSVNIGRGLPGLEQRADKPQNSSPNWTFEANIVAIIEKLINIIS